jgi:hypothetical protein
VSIDLATEQLIPLADVRLPGRAGKKIHFSTVWRWVTTGVRGPGGNRVRLQALRIGAKWVTSRRAIQAFAEALTPHLDVQAEPAATCTAGQRRRAAERAGEQLAALGI